MIFVPVARSVAEALRDSGLSSAELTGYAATPAQLRAHGFDPRDDEDANFTAQSYAMTAGLPHRDGGEQGRIVLAVDAPATALDDRDNADGEIGVTGLEWRWVQAVFSDGADVDSATVAAVESAAAAVSGLELGVAIDSPAVQRLIDDHDLLWHRPDERW